MGKRKKRKRITPDEMLPGLSFLPLKKGERPMAAMLLIQSVNAEGVGAWTFAKDDGARGELGRMSDVELLGALRACYELQLRHVTDGFSTDD